MQRNKKIRHLHKGKKWATEGVCESNQVTDTFNKDFKVAVRGMFK